MASFRGMRASVIKMLALRSMNCLRFGSPELSLDEFSARQHPAGPQKQIAFAGSHDVQLSIPETSMVETGEGEVYLIAVKGSDVRLDALKWVLMHEVQSGDTVHVHGIVEEVRTDMGSKYRVNELAFNGVRWRKLDAIVQLMEQKLKAELAKYEATCRMKDVRLRVKVIAANPAEETLAASAKALGATMLLVDRKLQSIGKACARDPEFPDHCAVLLIDGVKCTTIRLALSKPAGAPGCIVDQQPTSPLPAFAVRLQRQSSDRHIFPGRGSMTPDTFVNPKTASHRSSSSDSSFWAMTSDDEIPPSLPRIRMRATAESRSLPRSLSEEAHPPRPPTSQNSSQTAEPSHPPPSGCQGCANCIDVNGGLSNDHLPAVYRFPSPAHRLVTAVTTREEVVVRLRSFTWQELEEATGGFPTCKLLGTGGFGRVYQGHLEDQPVAVKVLKALTPQADKQFEAEVELLGGIRHPNIVTLLGYCRADTERLLVYNLSPQGSLDTHLYGPKWPLTWDQRSQIVLGLATGLAYLHSRFIVHCDMRPSNVLLTKDYMPMIADFGLSVHLSKEEIVHKTTAMGSFGSQTSDGESSVYGSPSCVIGATDFNPDVQGTPSQNGYMDPEYLCTGSLTTKVDVYAFGVIVLGIVTGTRPFDANASLEAKTILQLGQSNLRQCMSLAEQLGDKMVDPRLERAYNPQELKQFLRLALMCINHKGAMRPTMAAVLEELQRYRLIEGSSLGR